MPVASVKTEATEFELRVQAFAPLLRSGEAFSHETALQLYGCPIRTLSNPMVKGQRPVSLHVAVPAPRNPRRASGVVGHKAREPFDVWVGTSGVRLVPPMLALSQAAATLSMPELVVAVDHLVLPRRGRDAYLDLASANRASSRLSSRGAPRLRKALRLSRVGAESRMETLLRLVLEAFGLAVHFELQANISDQRGWIGRFDLVCERYKLIVEYDGEQHRNDRDQYLKDLRRLERARAAGYRIIRVHARDLFGSSLTLVATIAEALGVSCPSAPLLPELLTR